MKELHPIVLERLANYFRMLSEPTRLKILNTLKDGSRNVTQITQTVGANQANVSKHLALLLDAGLVSRRQEGNCAIYNIADVLIFELCDLVCGRLAQGLAAQIKQHETALQTVKSTAE
jgi:DNA-binding transcriptional ArsR family regulator